VTHRTLLPQRFFLALSSEHRLPHPDKDPIQAIFYCFRPAEGSNSVESSRANYVTGIIAIQTARLSSLRLGIPDVQWVEDELGLFNAFEDRVMELDPDALSGWELQNDSWGYLAERMRTEYGTCFPMF
jgi:DNA polymerase zeta